MSETSPPRIRCRAIAIADSPVYCRDLSEFVRLAKPIGRWLLHRGHLMVLVDALERVPGMPGVFFKDRGPKYARGPSPPRLGDLSFCENVLFGP